MNLFLSIGLAFVLAAGVGGTFRPGTRRLVIPRFSPPPLESVFREYRRWIDRELARRNYSARLFGTHCALSTSFSAKTPPPPSPPAQLIPSPPVAPHVGARSETTNKPPVKVYTVTGYCNCGKCCGWEKSWFGFGPPVYASGKLKGQTKQVGVTATGTKAHRGTVAANQKVLPFGTRLKIPGYGEGTVEDTGGALQGLHIDVWFPTHEEAVKWGVRKLSISQLQN